MMVGSTHILTQVWPSAVQYSLPPNLGPAILTLSINDDPGGPHLNRIVDSSPYIVPPIFVNSRPIFWGWTDHTSQVPHWIPQTALFHGHRRYNTPYGVGPKLDPWA